MFKNKDTGKILYSSKDLTTFQNCAFASWLDRLVHEGLASSYSTEAGIKLNRTQDTPFDELLKKKGNQWEESVLAEMRRKTGGKMVEIEKPFQDGKDSDLLLREGIRKTAEAMRSRAPAIYQPILTAGSWLSMPDFLILSDTGFYEPFDAKLASRVKTSFLLQMCVAAKILRDLDGTGPKRIGVFLRDLKTQTPLLTSFPTEDYRYFFERLESRFLEFQNTFNPNMPPTIEPEDEPGPWAEVVEKLRDQRDCVSRVAGIQSRQVRLLNDAGIQTLTQLGQAKKKDRPQKVQIATFEKLRLQARAQAKTQEQEGVLFWEPRDKGSALENLPMRSREHDVVIDMESTSFGPSGTWVYLWGLLAGQGASDQVPKAPRDFEAFSQVQGPSESVFSAGWALDPTLEAKVAQNLIHWLYARKKAHPEMHAYHYSHAEMTQLERLAAGSEVCALQLAELIKARTFVDLHAMCVHGLVVGGQDYSLKTVEKILPGHQNTRADGLAGATDSMAGFDLWLEEIDSKRKRERLSELEDYNRKDCVSTWALIDFLARVQVDNQVECARPSIPVEDVPVPAQIENPSTGILHDLHDFFRRENRVFWADLFRKLEQSQLDHEDDPELLAGVVHQGRGIYAYTPGQVSKIKAGDAVILWESLWAFANTADKANHRIPVFTVKQVQEAKNRIELEEGEPYFDDNAPASFPATRALILYSNFDRQIKAGTEPCLQKTLEDCQSGKPLALLERGDLAALQNPKLTRPMTPAELVQILQSLSDTSCEVLAIQGPPGSGKTTLGARAAVELIRESVQKAIQNKNPLLSGRKVGVTANSHAAINLFLTRASEALVQVPQIEDLPFLTFPITKTISKPEDAVPANTDHPEARHLVLCKPKEYFKKNFKGLIHGASHLSLCREQKDREKNPKIRSGGSYFDYLFVDEASQMSLATLVALTRCTRHLILLGDQMQLAQPIRAAHPGESGLSGLHFYSQGQRVLSPPRGIFLDKTHRMNSDLCTFVSDLFYESRLSPTNAATKTHLGTAGNPESSGVYFIPALHSGCTQGSQEEADQVVKLVSELVGKRAVIHGKERALDLKDILIVAPYNMQVEWIRRAFKSLPKKAQADLRVGTVDRFQGQEAAVVILSMSASPDAKMSRGVDFLLDLNRMNVALSRAQAASFVVGHPSLADIRTLNPETARLVNAYCKVVVRGAEWKFSGRKKS